MMNFINKKPSLVALLRATFLVSVIVESGYATTPASSRTTVTADVQCQTLLKTALALQNKLTSSSSTAAAPSLASNGISWGCGTSTSPVYGTGAPSVTLSGTLLTMASAPTATTFASYVTVLQNAFFTQLQLIFSLPSMKPGVACGSTVGCTVLRAKLKTLLQFISLISASSAPSCWNSTMLSNVGVLSANTTSTYTTTNSQYTTYAPNFATGGVYPILSASQVQAVNDWLNGTFTSTGLKAAPVAALQIYSSVTGSAGFLYPTSGATSAAAVNDTTFFTATNCATSFTQ